MKRLVILILTLWITCASVFGEGIHQVESTVDGGEIPEGIFTESGVWFMILNPEAKDVAVIDFINKVFNKWGYNEEVVVPAFVMYNGVEYKVVRIGQDTFNTSSKIVLPNSIKAIESNCFNGIGYDLDNMITFSFPEYLESIENNCFNRTMLTEIILPKRLLTIGNECFSGNNKLETIEIGRNIRRIGDRCFSSNPFIKEINLPNSLYFIGNGSFSDCIAVERVRLPRYLSFEHQNNLSYLEIFNNCPNIKIIEWDNRLPVGLPNSFNMVDKKNCKVIVPDGCKQIYSENSYWKDFIIVEESEFQLSATTVLNSNDSEGVFFTLNGFRVNSKSNLEKDKIYIKLTQEGISKFLNK